VKKAGSEAERKKMTWHDSKRGFSANHSGKGKEKLSEHVLEACWMSCCVCLVSHLGERKSWAERPERRGAVKALERRHGGRKTLQRGRERNSL